jgi:DNA-directed RNA polymerase subunit F
MFQNFFIKKMLESQLKNVSKEQQEKIMKAISDNPEFFTKLAEDVKKEMDSGKNQMAAIMSVLPKYQDELKRIMGQ